MTTVVKSPLTADEYRRARYAAIGAYRGDNEVAWTAIHLCSDWGRCVDFANYWLEHPEDVKRIFQTELEADPADFHPLAEHMNVMKQLAAPGTDDQSILDKQILGTVMFGNIGRALFHYIHHVQARSK